MRTILDLKPLITLTKEDFYQLCQVNPDVPLELSRNGELIIMSVTGNQITTSIKEYKILTLARYSNPI